MRTAAYVTLALGLCVFGYLALLSIGTPFLLTGLAMIAVAPWRHRRTVLWPAIAAPWAFAVTYALIAPLGCATSTAPGAADSATECSNIFGISYAGGAGYDPPLLPALAVGIAVATMLVLATRALLARHVDRR